MKKIALARPAKDQRERAILLGLVELYLETGKPIGSHTLQACGFKNFSSATIRNYFSKLEEEGYLKQQHSSGGRIPTELAYQLYASTYKDQGLLDAKSREKLRKRLVKETREPAIYLAQAAEELSEICNMAVFLSAPRFDQDFVLDIKILGIDDRRCLCALITDFGQVYTELLYPEKKLTAFQLKHIEAFFRWRITGVEQPKLSREEEAIAERFYKEVMLRHLVRYSQFSVEEIYKTGFSKLLTASDFNEVAALASGLSLFENPLALRKLSSECLDRDELCCWIGAELATFAPEAGACSALAIPYKINQHSVGTLALLGPQRLPYRQLFGLLEEGANCISQTLTQSIYKFKITYREPQITASRPLALRGSTLLEDKR